MSIVDPNATSVGDICKAAMKEAGALGVGQTALEENLTDVWARLQWMLQEWQRQRFLVYQLQDYALLSTGAETYSVGPLADFDTGINSMRPSKIESSFVRLVNSGTGSGPYVDYPVKIIAARETYNRISLKSMTSFTEYLFYDPGMPWGTAYPWPIPQANTYQLHLTMLGQLGTVFASLDTVLRLPPDYFMAIVKNLAVNIRPLFGIVPAQGDNLAGDARGAMQVLRMANTAIPELVMPAGLMAGGTYNVFNDRFT